MPPRRFSRPTPQREIRKLFVIATEGKETEKLYFSVFKDDEYRKNIDVNVLPTRHGESSPRNVLKRLNKYVSEHNLRSTDELWIVIDVDNWGVQALNELCQKSIAANYHVAVSNPSFELWLLLHQENPPFPAMTKDCITEITYLLGRYDKANYEVKKLTPYIKTAIEHAQRLDQDPNHPWPRSTGTHVYRLVAKLVNA